ncbi:MAG: hypothetical protein HFACDABA_00860 [Anaerolineales bacterium]|nr:hypothetical protein [Anaerolineales bacterium]
MECWHCNRPSHGACRFCGRGICREHAQKMPFILEIYKDKAGQNKAVVVDDTLWCGVCKPKDAPVILKDLD